MGRVRPRAARTVTNLTTLPPAVTVGLLGVGLSASWAIHTLVGGAPIAPPHLFYVPISLAALRFGSKASVPAAFIATFLAGPLLPPFGSQPLSDWATRGGFFILMAVVLAVLCDQLRHGLRTEADLDRRERNLLEREKAFIRNVSHELRTPLTVLIGGTATLIRFDAFSNDRAADIAASMSRAGDRLQQIVETILAVVELDRVREARSAKPPEDDAVKVEQMLRDILQTLPNLAAESRAIIAIAPGAELIVAPRRLIRNALAALIENALKFSPPTRPVEVIVEGNTERRFTVMDHGDGIPAEFIERAVEPFEQWDQSIQRTTGGLGICLFVAKSVAELLGGHLSITSSPTGTEVNLTIPQPSAQHQRLART